MGERLAKIEPWDSASNEQAGMLSEKELPGLVSVGKSIPLVILISAIAGLILYGVFPHIGFAADKKYVLIGFIQQTDNL